MDPRMQAWLNVNTENPQETGRIAGVLGRLQSQADPAQQAQMGSPDFSNMDPEFMQQLLEKIREWERMQGMGGAGSMGAGGGQMGELAGEI